MSATMTTVQHHDDAGDGRRPKAADSTESTGSASSPRLTALLERWAATRPRAIGKLRQLGWALDDAEDIFATALLRAVDSSASLRDDDAAEAWFWTLLRRSAVDLGRERALARARDGGDAYDELAAVEDEDGDDPCACSLRLLELLPPTQAEILRTIDVAGARVASAAASLGISANNASVRLFRARTALRSRLEAVCGTRSSWDCRTCGCD